MLIKLLGGKTRVILRAECFFSVPAFLSHDPPVLLHPERVVPLSQMEQFESTFQPNVALAPPAHRHETVPKQEVTLNYNKLKYVPSVKEIQYPVSILFTIFASSQLSPVLPLHYKLPYSNIYNTVAICI